jgi:predicted Rossmann-fold nucleotide-binding protein
LLTFVDHAVEEQFLRAEHRSLVVVADEPDDLLSKLDRAQAPALPKWVDRSTT